MKLKITKIIWGLQFIASLCIGQKDVYFSQAVSEQDLDALRTVADSGGYNILIISKIDPDCRVLDTQMLIGIAFSDFQAIFDMYDDSMF
jgi:hypothetical protein